MNRLSLFLIAMVLICQTTNTRASEVKLDVGYLGVSSESISKKKAKVLGFDNLYGSYITRIWPNTPAAKANLQVFDYIFGIDNQITEHHQDMDDLMRNKKPGDAITLHFIRKNVKRAVRVTLGKRSNSFYFSTSDDQKAFLGVTDDCSCPEGEIGVQVGIVYNSTAQKMGLKDGDIITTINNYPMYDWGDITTAISSLRPNELIKVAYTRAGRNYTASDNVKSYKATKEEERAARNNARPAFLGIYSNVVSKEKAKKLGFENIHGSYITRVIPNTTAAEINLKPFDYVYGIDQYRVGENQTLTNILAKYHEGEEAKLYFIRKGRLMTSQIVFGARSRNNNSTDRVDECEDPFLGVRNNYSKLSEMGVTVSIVKNSTAEEMGMKTGDVITHINEYMIIDWSDLSIAINNTKVGEPIEVIYIRNGQKLQSSKPIKSQCDMDNRNGKILYRINPDEDSQVIIKGNRSRGENSRVRIRIEDATQRDLNNLSLASRRKIFSNNQLKIENLSLIVSQNRENVSLSFEIDGRGDTQIQIYSQNGRSLYNYELDSFSGVFMDELDIAQNGSGIYFLQIRQDEKSLIKKIYLQKQ